MNLFIFGVSIPIYRCKYILLLDCIFKFSSWFGLSICISWNTVEDKTIEENVAYQPYKTKLKDWNSLYAISVICIIFIIIYSIVVVIENFI